MSADQLDSCSCDLLVPALSGPRLLAAPRDHLPAPSGGCQDQLRVPQEAQEAAGEGGDRRDQEQSILQTATLTLAETI